MTKLRQSFFEMVGEHWFAKQVSSGAVVMETRGLFTQFVPVIQSAVATAQPRQCHKVDLLVLGQRIDECSELLLPMVGSSG
jgi:hypothetical protein